MGHRSLRLKPGTLWPAIVERTESALRCGALHPIHTEQRFLEEQGVRFLVRSVSSLERKAREKSGGKTESANKPFNPFLPPDPELTVADISHSHLAVLNKFNVLDHHLLIVTREFEHQERPLGEADFEALWLCMAEFEALGFYNGGVIAGASQPHKHLQLIPLPLVAGEKELPITPLLEKAPWEQPLMEIPGLGFRHIFAPLEPDLVHRPEAAAATTLQLFEQMLQRLGIGVRGENGEQRLSPYNLLVTRRWMLMAPRTEEFFQSVSINALGFAGSLFVRNEQEMELVRRYGPMNILKEVSSQ